ncbi:MAG: hypothetical protein RL648_1403 [Verrucomicrobiota bacterium]|jgi:hypothetical protein
MKTPSVALLFCLLGLFVALAVPAAEAAEPVALDVILVRASEGEPLVDAGLRPYAANLQRLFRFDRYEIMARKSVTLKSEAQVALFSDQRVQLRLDEATASSARVELDWTRGSTRLLQTRVQLAGRLPAVLGGPRGDEGILLLLVVRK